MPRRRGDGPEHTRARRRAQEAAVRGLVAEAVTEAHEAHAADQRDLTGSAGAFLNEAALPAVRALNRAGVPTLLPAMHRIVNAARPGLISPEAALYGHWMEWRTSNRSGRPLSMGDTLRLTGAGSAMSFQSSAPALLHALRTRCPGATAPYLNQVRATYQGGVSGLDAALHLLLPPDEDLEVAEVTVFVVGADEAPTCTRPTKPVYDGTGRTPPYAVVCGAFPREPAWCPALPLATHAPRGWANPHLSPPLSRTRSARHRGQVLWQARPGTPLLLLIVATREDPERVLGITPTRLHGAAPVPRPRLPAPAAPDGVHTFLRTQEVTAVTGVHLVQLGTIRRPPGAQRPEPRPDRDLWRDVWAAWLNRLPAECRWMAAGPRPHGDNATAGPPSPPPPPSSGALHSTAHGTTQIQREVMGGAHLPQRMPTRITGCRTPIAPPSGTTATTAGPAPAPPSPRETRGRPSRSATVGAWRRRRCRSGRRPGSRGQPPPTPGRQSGDLRQPRRPPPPPRLRARGGPRHTGGRDRSPSKPCRSPNRVPRRAASEGQGPGAGARRLTRSRLSRRGGRRGCARSRNHGSGEPRHHPGRPRRGPQYAMGMGDRPRAGPGRLAGGHRSSSSG